MSKASPKPAAKTPRSAGRSSVTGRLVLMPATKPRSLTIDRAREIAREVAARKGA